MTMPSLFVFELLPQEPARQSSIFDRHPDDWTGISNASRRRKIQNRLNQRASRDRRRKTNSSLSQLSNGVDLRIVFEATDVPRLMLPKTLLSNMRTLEISTIIDQRFLKETTSFNGVLGFQFATCSQPSTICITASDRKSITSAYNFVSWITSKSKEQGSNEGFPLSADHLLTLVRFNVFRALIANIIAIGVDPELMSLDITSPFFSPIYGPSVLKKPLYLPSFLEPTDLQRQIKHHPFIDVFPCSRIRDNFLRAGDSYSEDELCSDILGLEVVSSSTAKASEELQKYYPTGLLVWGEPWHPRSWEITAEFATKWSWLLIGCDELLESTNYWRSMRGEESLIWEVESTT